MHNAQQKFYTAGYLVFLLVLVYAFIQVLSYIQNLVLLLIASTLLAYIIHPAVRFFEKPIIIPKKLSFTIFKRKIRLWHLDHVLTLHKKGYSRVGALLVVFVIMLVGLVVFFSFISPRVSSEFKNLSQNLPGLTRQAEQTVRHYVTLVEQRLPAGMKGSLSQISEQVVSRASEYTSRAASLIITWVSSIVSFAAALIFIPLLTFWILLDLETIKDAFYTLVPNARQEEIQDLMGNIDKVLGRFIRGQILSGLVVGIMTTIALLILGVPYAFLFGLLSGALEFIPYVGVIISFIPILTLALIYKGLGFAFITFLVLEGVQIFESQVIAPLILGSVVGLPPLVIIIALFIGGQLLGIAGMLIAVPIAAILRVVSNFYLKQAKNQKESVPQI